MKLARVLRFAQIVGEVLDYCAACASALIVAEVAIVTAYSSGTCDTWFSSNGTICA